MDKIGIDLGKKKSDVCVMSSPTTVSERFQVPTTRSALAKVFARRAPAQIAVESCRSSCWVKEVLERLGHEVVVLDTTRVRALGVGQGRRKNDRRDAEAQARALWAGVVPRAHVLSDEARRLRDVLHARGQLVAQRTSLVTMVRGQFEAYGIVVRSCVPEVFAAVLGGTRAELLEAPHVQSALRVLAVLNEEIAVLTAELQSLAARQEPYERLCSVPGVKLVVGLSFIAALDRAARFRDAHQVQAYLGLVPSEASTGGRQRLGHITKAGNPLARAMLVQAAHSLLNARKHQEDALVVWARQLAARRGKRVAAVGLARRIAGVLWAMWRDGTMYDAHAAARASAAGMSRRLGRERARRDEMARLAVS
jgi:transposase